MMPPKRQRESHGYSLIELLVVMVVLGIVASIAIAAVHKAREKARQRATMADMRTISKALETYAIDHGRIPDGSLTMLDLQVLLIPYQTTAVPIEDHWNHEYSYTTDADRNNYTLESFGKDGIDGLDITVPTRNEFERDIVLSNGKFVAAPNS